MEKTCAWVGGEHKGSQKDKGELETRERQMIL